MTLDDFVRALGTRIKYEVVQCTGGPKQIRLVGRVLPPDVPQWLEVVNRLLQPNDGWAIDISKQYFLKAGKTVFGWRLILQGEDINSSLDSVLQTALSAPRVQVELDEYTLAGVGADRNAASANSRGKGAQDVNKAVIGRAAASMMGSR